MALLMALVLTANSYIVAFFEGQNCDPDTHAGAECTDIDQLTCCVAPEGRLFVSVGQDASWGYSIQDDDACGVVLDSGEDCYSVDSGLEVISGGSVVGIVGTSSQQSEPPKVAKADTWFFRNGTEKYTLPVDSDYGRLYGLLEDPDVRRDFITSHGRFTRIEE